MNDFPIPSWRIKFFRGREHLEALLNELRWYREGRPYDFSVVRDESTMMNRLVITRLDRLSPRWSALIGDCVQAFRATLNHAVFQIGLNEGVSENDLKWVEFPIYREFETFNSWKRRKIGLLSDGAQSVIESLQPYNANGDTLTHPLVLLDDLAARDRHRTIHFVTVNVSPELIVGDDRYPQPKPSGPLDIGSVIAEFDGRTFYTKYMEGKGPLIRTFNVNADVAFADETPAAGRLVIPTLDDIGVAVSDALTALRPFIERGDSSLHPEHQESPQE